MQDRNEEAGNLNSELEQLEEEKSATVTKFHKREKIDHSATDEFNRGWKNGYKSYYDHSPMNQFNQGQSEDYKDGWKKGYEQAKKNRPYTQDEVDSGRGKSAALSTFKKVYIRGLDALKDYVIKCREGLLPIGRRSAAYIKSYREKVEELVKYYNEKDELNIPEFGQKEKKTEQSTEESTEQSNDKSKSRKRPREDEESKSEREAKKTKYDNDDDYKRGFENGIAAYKKGADQNACRSGGRSESYREGWNHGYKYAAEQFRLSDDERVEIRGTRAAQYRFRAAVKQGPGAVKDLIDSLNLLGQSDDVYTKAYCKTIEALAKGYEESKQAEKNTTQSQQSSTSLIETKMVSAVSDDASTNNPQHSDEKDKKLAACAARTAFGMNHYSGTLFRFLASYKQRINSSKKSKAYKEAYCKTVEELARQNEHNLEFKQTEEEKPKSAALNNIGVFYHKPPPMPAGNTSYLDNPSEQKEKKTEQSTEESTERPVTRGTYQDFFNSRTSQEGGEGSGVEHDVANIPATGEGIKVSQSGIELTRKFGEYIRGWRDGIKSYNCDSSLKMLTENESEKYQQGRKDGYEYAASLQPLTEDQQAKKPAEATAKNAFNGAAQNGKTENLVANYTKKLVRTNESDAARKNIGIFNHNHTRMPANNRQHLDNPSEQKEKKTKQDTEGSTERSATPSARGSLMLFDPRTLKERGENAVKQGAETDVEKRDAVKFLANLIEKRTTPGT